MSFRKILTLQLILTLQSLELKIRMTKFFEDLYDEIWRVADSDAELATDAVQATIALANQELESYNEFTNYDDDVKDFLREAGTGISTLNNLLNDVGFELRGVFRRRELTPFIFNSTARIKSLWRD